MASNVKYLLIWLNIGSVVVSEYRHYAMDTLCGTVLSMDTENIFGATLSLNLSHSSPGQGQCDVIVKGSTSMYADLHVFVSEFITNVTSCSNYSLVITHGDSQNVTYQHPDIPTVCDDTQNKMSYTTWKTYLQFTFTWDTALPEFYLQIVFNAYSPDSCPDDDDDAQTECKNDRCIPSILRCQGYNPCGDKSDCTDDSKDLSYTVKILYSIGSVIVLIFVLAIIYNVCFKPKWSEHCKCDDGNCCKELCTCMCVILRDCFGACLSSIKNSGSKIKGCCCRCCCKNTVSTDGSTGNTSHSTERIACAASNGMAPPPYSFRPFSPPPTYSVAMRNAPPPEYTEVFDISVDPTSEPPPEYDLISCRDSVGVERRS